jgi:hypothetical protein
MHLAFYATDKPSDTALTAALMSAGHCVDVILDHAQTPEADAYCFVGVKRADLAGRLADAGKRWLYWDKGYNRRWPHWWRVTCCAQQPTRYLMDINRPSDRATVQGWLRTIKPWRVCGDHIVFAGSSAKYHGFVGHDNVDPTKYAQQVINEIRARTQRRIVYRPKPSWKAAVPVQGAEYSARHTTGDIHQALEWAHVLVTHGSSTCFDALVAGVPSIVLGDGVLRPISSTSLDDIEQPILASDIDRRQLLCNLAYCQWSLAEIKSGAANDYLNYLVHNAI